MTQLKRRIYGATLVIYTLLSIGSTLFLIFKPTDTNIQERFEDTKEQLKQIQDHLLEHEESYENTIELLQKRSDSLEHIIAH